MNIQQKITLAILSVIVVLSGIYSYATGQMFREPPVSPLISSQNNQPNEVVSPQPDLPQDQGMIEEYMSFRGFAGGDSELPEPAAFTSGDELIEYIAKGASVVCTVELDDSTARISLQPSQTPEGTSIGQNRAYIAVDSEDGLVEGVYQDDSLYIWSDDGEGYVVTNDESLVNITTVVGFVSQEQADQVRSSCEPQQFSEATFAVPEDITFEPASELIFSGIAGGLGGGNLEETLGL